jgi:queuine tRNA-ribosyltransferase
MEEVRESLAKDRFSAYREEFHRNRQRGVEPGQD